MMREVYAINKQSGVKILLARIVGSILPLVQLYLVKELIDLIGQQAPTTAEIVLLVFLFAAIQLALGTLNQYTNHIEQLFNQEVADAFSLRIIIKASKVEYAHFENPAFHNSLHLAQQQARFRITQLLPAINATVSNAMSLVFLVVFFVSIKAYFFIAVFVLAIPITLNKWLQGKRSTDLEFSLAPRERESGYLFQLMTGIQWAKELRTFRFGKTFQERFQGLRKEINLEKSLIQKKSLQQNLLAEFFEVSALALAIGYLAIRTVAKSIGLGTFVLYLQGIQRMQTSSKAFFQSLLQVFQLRSFVKDLYGFFELSEGQKTSTEQHFPDQVDQLSIESLSFGYPNQQHPIISGINIKASRGQIIAIVGENGSGKSTLVKLLAGLYTADQGSIQLNGVNIMDIQQHAFYQQTCFFFQDYEKYFLTAGQNIHFEYNTTNLVEKKASEAGQSSGASTFIEKLPKRLWEDVPHAIKRSIMSLSILSPEFKLMLSCCRVKPGSRELERRAEALGVSINEEAFLGLLLRHRVFPIVYFNLQQESLVSVSLKDKLKQIAEANQLHALQSRQMQYRLQKELDRKEYKGFFLKGVSLSEHYYGDAGLRHVMDIDLWVEQKAIEPIAHWLFNEGYCAAPDIRGLNARQFAFVQKTDHDLQFLTERPGLPKVIELHWKLRGPLGGFNLQPETPMNEVDHFLYLCTHGTEHGWFRMKWLFDLPPDHRCCFL